MTYIEIDTITDRFALIEPCDSFAYVLYLPFDSCNPVIDHQERSLITGISSQHYHHLSYQVLPSDIDALALQKTVSEWDFTPIIEGSSITMDGNKQVGHLTKEAKNDVDAFFEAVCNCGFVEVINLCDDSLGLSDVQHLGLTAESTEKEIAEIEGEFRDEAEARGAYLIGSVEDELMRLRDDLRAQQDEEASD